MEINSIREFLKWDASYQEIEFRNIGYVEKNIGFKNCASDDIINLKKVNWSKIICLDLKFDLNNYNVLENPQYVVLNYTEYFKYAKIFLNSSGEKNLHPQIFVNVKTFNLFKKLVNDFNDIFLMPINKKNFLEFTIWFEPSKDFSFEDDVNQVINNLNFSQFKMYEKNIFTEKK